MFLPVFLSLCLRIDCATRTWAADSAGGPTSRAVTAVAALMTRRGCRVRRTAGATAADLVRTTGAGRLRLHRPVGPPSRHPAASLRMSSSLPARMLPPPRPPPPLLLLLLLLLPPVMPMLTASAIASLRLLLAIMACELMHFLSSFISRLLNLPHLQVFFCSIEICKLVLSSLILYCDFFLAFPTRTRLHSRFYASGDWAPVGVRPANVLE